MSSKNITRGLFWGAEILKLSIVSEFLFRSLSIFAVIFAATSAQARPSHVILIRHGEKPGNGQIGLSKKGIERGKAMAMLFEHSEFKELGSPVALFAQAPKSNGKQARPLETLKYLSAKLNLKIDTSFQRDNTEELAKYILRNSKYNGKVVLVCWEHNRLEEIALKLGLKTKPKYPDNRFDLAWLLTFEKGKAPELKKLPEKLLPGDEND